MHTGSSTIAEGPSAQRGRRPILAAGSLIVAALLIINPAAAARAHDGVLESSPAPDSTVSTQLSEVSMRFSDELLDLGGEGAFVIQVVGPDANFYNLGCVNVEDDTASTDVSLGRSGTYTVTWQVISSDGHPTSDSFSFDYNQPEEVGASPGTATAPCLPGAAIEGESEGAPAQGGTGVGPNGILIGGGILVFVLVAAAVAVAIVGRRLRRAQSSES
jgi:copper resistance protein C